MNKSLYCMLFSLFFMTKANAQLNWQQTNGPYGGNNYALAVNPSNNYIFTGNGYRGVFLSTNNGVNWTYSGLTNKNVLSFAISGSNIFAGTSAHGLFLSTNNGTNWLAVNEGLTDDDIRAIAISGSNIFVGTYEGGVFLSTNSGTNWLAVNEGLTDLDIRAIAISGTNIFAGTVGGGVFLSTNNGTNWTAVNTGLTDTYVSSMSISGSNIFAGTYGGGVFLSTNNGTNWMAVNSGLTNLDIRDIAISGSNIFAGTPGGGVFLSTNNGTNWMAVNSGLPNLNIEKISISGSNIFVGTNGSGVFLSTNNGLNWTEVNSGLTLEVNAITISGSNIFAGTDGSGVFLSTNNGSSWTITGSTYGFVSALIISGSNLFAGTGGGVLLSTNNGSSWTVVSNGLTDGNVASLTASGSNLFAGTKSGGVFLSTNNGTSWTAVNNGLTNLWVSAFAISGSNLFAGTFGGGVFLSTNNGSSWTAVNNGLTSQHVNTFAISGSNLFAGTSGGGVFLSTNNGSSWTAVNNGLTNPGVFALTFRDSNLFAGTYGGVFLSTDNGSSWTVVNNGLTNLYVHALAVSETNLFAGTESSVSVAAMIAPTAPSSLTVSGISATRINLTWSHSGNNPDRYRIYRSTPNNTNYVYHDSTTSASYSDTINTTHNTIYYYKIYGVNTWGVSPASNEDSAKTFLGTPTAPSSLTASGVSSSQVNLTWTASGNNPERYRIYRSTGTNTSHVYHDSTTSTSYSDTKNTTPYNIYYYKVYGVNTWGVSDASNEDSAKTMMVAPSIVGTPNVNPSAPDPGQSVTVTVTVNGTSPTVSLYFGNSLESLGKGVTMIPSGNIYSYTIPTDSVTTDGLWYRILAQNEAGTSGYPWVGNWMNIPVTLNNTSFNSVLTASGIPAQFPKEKYFTVALPCSSASVNLVTLWGAQEKNSSNIPTNWRAGTFNSSTQQFSDVSVLNPNTAYVIYNSAGVHPFTSLTTGLTNAPGLLDNITLVQGWNLIPWPYASTVNVSVTNAAEIDPIWYLDDTGWHGSASQFKPFRAYAIRKKTSGSIGLMNVISISSALAKTESMNGNWNWSVKLSASCGDHYDSDNFIGTGENALNEYDPADAAEPFDMQNGVSMYFAQSGQKLAFDIRSSDDPGHIWEAVLANHTNQSKMTLTWTNVQITGSQEAWLVDIDNNKFINLMEQSAYTFKSRVEHHFKVIAGDKNFTEKELTELKKTMPEHFSLYQNYPNPFNPNTTIKFDVAKTGNVKLQIYNVLGQLVATIVNGNLETGKYDIQWNGKDVRGNAVSSGIYIYRLATDGYVKARKMILVR